MADAPKATQVQNTTLPDLTVPQILALAAFFIFFLAGIVSGDKITGGEYDEVRKLTVFLIGALLPSDVVIRFGRSLFLRGQDDNPAASVKPTNPAAEMQRVTVPQVAAFVAFVAVVVAALLREDLISSGEFSDINDVAVFLIAALLPSEATIRFARALYLRGASDVTAAHLKKI